MAIDAADLAAMQAAQEAAFDTTADVYRATTARSAVGGTTQTWGTKKYTYACRIANTRPPAEFIAGGRLSGGRVWAVTFAHDADVRAEDKLVVGSLTLYVVGTLSGESYQTALRVIAEERT